MIRAYECGHAAAFLERKRTAEEKLAADLSERKAKGRRRDWIIISSYFLIGVTAIVAGKVFHVGEPPKKKPPVLIEGSRVNVPDARGNEVLWDSWIRAARLARSRWSSALGREIEDFSLVADAEACGPEAIACASEIKNIIYVAQEGRDVDRATVMMHEIGHLLGVNHIEGDVLMDKEYQGLLEAPSPAAVAVAKVEAKTCGCWTVQK